MAAGKGLTSSEYCVLALLDRGAPPRLGARDAARPRRRARLDLVDGTPARLHQPAAAREPTGTSRPPASSVATVGRTAWSSKRPPTGEKLVREWLRQPVEHVRDIRSLFLVKVVLAQRLGYDTEPLLVAQRALMTPFVAWLEARLDDVDPIAEPDRGDRALLPARDRADDRAVHRPHARHGEDRRARARLARSRRAELPEPLGLGPLVGAAGALEPVQRRARGGRGRSRRRHPAASGAAASQAIVSAPSAGVRRSGPMTRLNRGSASRIPGVSAQPGCIALTVTPLPARRRAHSPASATCARLQRA